MTYLVSHFIQVIQTRDIEYHGDQGSVEDENDCDQGKDKGLRARVIPEASLCSFSEPPLAQPVRIYKGEAAHFDVRNEPWYSRYFASNETVMKNLYLKDDSVEIKMVGIQGCLTYGIRTR